MDPNTVNQLHQQLRDEFATEFNISLNALHSQVDRLQQENATLHQFTMNIVAPGRPKPALPDPEKFSNSLYHFDTWLLAIKAKLRTNTTALGDDITYFYYIYLNLNSSVQIMILPQLATAKKTEHWDYKTLLD